MAVESYVEDILESPESTFREILSKIIAKSDKNAKIEMVRQYTQVDTILFEAIKSILSDLRIEEGFVSRFLYRFFGIEIFKNRRREQLIILGSELKTQHISVEREKNRVDTHIKRLIYSLENLTRLKDGIDNKKRFLKGRREVNKSNSFIKKINKKIEELNRYRDSLEQKYLNISDIEKIYNTLYLRIPRYYELQEDTHLNLLSEKI